MKLFVPLVVLVLSLCPGCSTTPSGNPADPAPKYAGRINVARYDVTPRVPSTAFEVFTRADEVQQPYKIIALLSHESKPKDSGLMINAIAWRARQLGADAMILLPPQETGLRWNQWGVQKQQPIYSANAIVYTP